MEVLIINGDRHLINTTMCDKAQDEVTQRILSGYPKDAQVDWDDTPTIQDTIPATLGQLINKYK